MRADEPFRMVGAAPSKAFQFFGERSALQLRHLDCRRSRCRPEPPNPTRRAPATFDEKGGKVDVCRPARKSQLCTLFELKPLEGHCFRNY